jgi:hypothetical protein
MPFKFWLKNAKKLCSNKPLGRIILVNAVPDNNIVPSVVTLIIPSPNAADIALLSTLEYVNEAEHIGFICSE